MVKQTGKIGILVGSHGYINQETSEISFRSYMREYSPQQQLLEPIVNLDDESIAYDAISEMLAKYPDLVAIYVAGGGQDGLIRALREHKGPIRPIAVCNELTPSTKAALIDDIIEVALVTPVGPLSSLTVEMMIKACNNAR